QHDHPSGQKGDHAAETLLSGLLHLLDLVELAGIEEDGVRVEAAQEAGDGALEKGLFRRDRVGGVLLHDRVGVDDGLQPRIEVVRSVEGGGGTEQSCDRAKHQSGQTWDISIWTSGKWRGFRMPSPRMARRRS